MAWLQSRVGHICSSAHSNQPHGKASELIVCVLPLSMPNIYAACLQGELLHRAINLTVGESVARSNATAMEQYLAGLRSERDAAKTKADSFAEQLLRVCS